MHRLTRFLSALVVAATGIARLHAAADFIPGAGFSLGVAKLFSSLASEDERKGKYREALKGYGQVIDAASHAINQADMQAEARTSGMFLVLGAAHFDAARMEHELQNLSDGDTYRSQIARIDDHLLLAEKALLKALDLDRSETAQPREKAPPGSPPQIHVSSRWLMEQALADVYAFRGETAKAREHYAAALKINPSAERANRAMQLVVEVEKDAKAKTSAVGAVASSPQARTIVVQLVRAAFGRAGAGWGIIAGGVTDLALEKFAAKK